jgi:hypothetical protein
MELPIIIEINLIKVIKGEKGRIGREAGWLDIVRFLCLRLRQILPPHLHLMFYIRRISRSILDLDNSLFSSIDRDCTH